MGKWLDMLRAWGQKPSAKPEPYTIIADRQLAEEFAVGRVALAPGVQMSIGNDVIEEIKKAGDIPGAIKPPRDAETEGWSWDAYQREVNTLMSENSWAPCRFAHRVSQMFGEDRAQFVFGVAAGNFGVWQMPFVVHQHDEGEPCVTRDEILTCLTHLPTGLGIGLFEKRKYAIQAADLAERLLDFRAVPYPSQEMGHAMRRLYDAMGLLGIVASHNCIAYRQDGAGPFNIIGINAASATIGKPEKLS